MAKRAEIETAIYDDPEFLALTPPARSVYVWSFTNQRTGQSGIYKVARIHIENETGWSGRQLDRALAELQDQRFLFYDGRVLFVRTRVKRIRTRYTETVAKAIASEVASLGAHPYVRLWLEENTRHPWATKHVESPDFTGVSDTPTRPPQDPQEGVPQLIPDSSAVDVEGETTTPGDQLPDDFPVEAIPLLDAVYPVVEEMARRHRCRLPTRYQVANTLRTRWRRKPVVSAAHDCAGHWANRPLSDPNAALRNWLDRCDDIAGPERLPDEPAAIRLVPTDRPRRPTASDWLREDFIDGEPIRDAEVVA